VRTTCATDWALACLLAATGPAQYVSPMRTLFACLIMTLACADATACLAGARTPRPAPRSAHRHAAGGPKRIGTWENWQAATHQEAGQPVCYAFTRPVASSPTLPGRGDVVLSVTERSGGRDAVALSAGFTYAPNAEVEIVSDGVTLPFYTSGRSAFARDGRAAVALFSKALQAQARSPGPRGKAVTDTFSLRGFSQAYAAIVKACPAK
jgi:hypothetical protein